MADPDDDDNDDELELEPVDPTVLAAERDRFAKKTEAIVGNVDVDELVRETTQNDGYDVDWSALKQFRFTTRHLLIVTAVLAIALTAYMRLGGCMAIFVASLTAVGAGWMWVSVQDRKLAQEREQRKRELLEKGFGTTRSQEPLDATPMPKFEIPDWRPAEFKFSFSLKQTLIAMTAAAVLMGVLSIFSLETLSLTVGIVAILGLVAQLAGFEAPPMLVFGWWLLLVMFLGLGVLAAVKAHFFAAVAAPYLAPWAKVVGHA